MATYRLLNSIDPPVFLGTSRQHRQPNTADGRIQKVQLDPLSQTAANIIEAVMWWPLGIQSQDRQSSADNTLNSHGFTDAYATFAILPSSFKMITRIILIERRGEIRKKNLLAWRQRWEFTFGITQAKYGYAKLCDDWTSQGCKISGMMTLFSWIRIGLHIGLYI